MCLAWQSFSKGSPRAATGHPKWLCLCHLDLRSRTSPLRNCTRLDWKSQHSVCVRSSRVTFLLLDILNCRSISTCLHWYKLVPTFELRRIYQSGNTSQSKKLGMLYRQVAECPWRCLDLSTTEPQHQSYSKVRLYLESLRWRTASFSSSPISPGKKTNDRDDGFDRSCSKAFTILLENVVWWPVSIAKSSPMSSVKVAARFTPHMQPVLQTNQTCSSSWPMTTPLVNSHLLHQFINNICISSKTKTPVAELP